MPRKTKIPVLCNCACQTTEVVENMLILVFCVGVQMVMMFLKTFCIGNKKFQATQVSEPNKL